MEANNRMLYDDIIKKTEVQYTIPVYQRNYTWEKENCDQLYDDILDAVNHQKNHFIGSLVYSMTKKGDLKCGTIVDGQQRLTTVMLLLKAIEVSIKDPENVIKKRIQSNLYNALCEDEYKLKLKDTEGDNNTLENVLMGNSVNLDNTSKVAINYNHFISRIKKSVTTDGYTYADLVEGIGRLEIVEIVLGENDSPQKIFESINHTGVELSTSALIRNFLLMGILNPKKQATIYKKYWVTMEELITKDNVEKFFHNFLVAKEGRQVDDNKIYETFKHYYHNHVEDSDDGTEKIFSEILKFARYYKFLVCNNSTEYSTESNELCKIFHILQHKTIYPFLLHVCEDFDEIRKLHIKNDENGEIELSDEEKYRLKKREEEFNNILKLFGNYALRRNIAHIPSSSLRRFYASLYTHIFAKNPQNYDHYYKAVEAYLCTLKTEDKMPSDHDFLDGLYYEKLYVNNKLNILHYFFDLIENSGKEKLNLSDLSIEHIMPETLNQDWMDDLGENYEEIFEKYVHTLGNLTLTGYNSEYSNLKFSTKKKKYQEWRDEGNVKVIKLNEELSSDAIESWGENEILNRAKRLSKLILNKFPYPTNIDTSLEFEKFYELYLEEPEEGTYEYIDNSSYALYGFQLFGQKYDVNKYAAIYRELIKLLYANDNHILEDMAKQNHTFRNSITVTYSTQPSTYLQEVLPNIYVYMNLDKYSVLSQMKELLEIYQIDMKDFCLLYVAKED